MKKTRVACALVPVLLAALVVGLGALARAGQPQQPSFSVSRDLVVLDVNVTRDGKVVPGLQAEDFVVEIDGNVRAVRSVRFVDGSEEPAAPPGGQAGGGAPARFSSNEGQASGRLILLVVDENSVGTSEIRRAAESIETLLAGFGGSDRVGLAALPGPRLLVDFTGDRGRVAGQFKGISGGASWAGVNANHEVSVLEAYAIFRGDTRVYDSVVRRECAKMTSDLDAARCPDAVRAEARRVVTEAGNRVRQFTTNFSSLLAALGRVDAPKIVILFSAGVASPEASLAFQALAPAVAGARTAIYAMRVEPATAEARTALPFLDDERNAAGSSLDTLAGLGGGSVVVLAGSGETPFRRLATQLGSYYLLGVESQPSDNDGKPHSIAVSVGGGGMSVRSRPSFVAAAKTADEAELLRGTLQSALPAGDLPVRLTAYSLADDTPGKVRLLVVGEIDREQKTRSPALVGFVLLDDAGKLVGSFSRRMDLAVTPAGRLSFIGGTSVAAGRYTLRLAAVRDGRAGRAEHQVTAALKDVASLTVGDLVLGEPPIEGSMLAPSFEGNIAGERLACYFQPGHAAGLSRDLSIDIVKESDGPALVDVPFKLQPSKSTATAIQLNIDVSLLPPGNYLARLSVADGESAAIAPFSLERRSGARLARKGAARRPGAPNFTPQELLEPSVVGPFLDDLSGRASELSRAAIARARAGEFGRALEGLEKGTKTDPAEPFLRGLALLSKGQAQEASEAFRESVRAAPDFMAGAFYIGACYAVGGKLTQAANAWQTSLIGLGQHQAVYRLLGEALVRAGDPDRALAVLDKAAARWPDEPAISAKALEAALDAGRYDQAFEQAGRVADSGTTNADLLFLAARAAFEAAFEKAVNATPAAAGRRLRQLRELYAASGGPRGALVSEWLAYLEGRTG